LNIIAAAAAAYRAGVVLPAVLRDPACNSEQVARRDRAVFIDRDSFFRALARHLQGAVNALSSDLQMVLLVVCGYVHRARLFRLAAAGRHLSHL